MIIEKLSTYNGKLWNLWNKKYLYIICRNLTL